MNRYFTPLFVLFFVQVAQAQEYVLPEQALASFVELNDYQPPEEWHKAKGGVKMPFDETGNWCPSHQHYVIYRVLHVRYWFKVTSTNQSTWLDKLKKMVENPAFAEVRWKIVVYSFSFQPLRKCLPKTALMKDGDLAIHREKQKDKLEQSYNWLNNRQTELDQMPWGGWKDLADAEQASNQAKQAAEAAIQELSKLLKGTEFGTAFAKLRGDMQQKIQNAARKGHASSSLYRDPSDLGFPPGTIGNDWESASPVDGQNPGPRPSTQTNRNPSENTPASPRNLDNKAPSSQPSPPNKPLADQAAPGKGPGNQPDGPNQTAPSDQKNSSTVDEKGGKGNDNADGKPGPFKIKVPLSKWFITLADIISTYLGIKDISLKVLTVAYLIAPEVFDFVGSYMAKLQHLMTPNNLEDFLNTLSDVYDYAMQFLQYANMASELLTNPDLHQLVKKIDWKKFELDKALDMGGKVGIIQTHHLQKIKKYFPVELIKGDLLANSDKLRTAFNNYAGAKIKEQVKRIPGVGRYADLDKLWDCAANQDKEECLDALKASVKKGVFSNIPPKFRYFSDAFEDAWKGDFIGAAEKVTASELAKRTGISVAEAQELLRHAKVGNWNAFIKTAASTQLKLKSPACRQSVQSALNGKSYTREELWRISRCILEETGNKTLADQIQLYGGVAYYAATRPNQLAADFKNTLGRLHISESALKNLLENNTDALLLLLAKNIGLTSPEAQEAFKKGDLNRAISAQTEWGMKYGLPRRDMDYYNQLGKRVKQSASNRVELLKTLVDAIRKDEITVPLDLGKLLENALEQALH